MEERERARTGIASLKVRYNRVFGYYIEISKSNLHAVPADYHRKQTIAGGERFITPALKEYEEKVLGADERILERELEIFERCARAVAAEAPRIQASARALATLDVLAALAEAAAVNNYIKPHVHDGDELTVVDGRHPVVERRHARRRRRRSCPTTSPSTADACQLVILTGPNMGGKSTYLRQTALLCVMAQAGSFVPAREAKIPLVDRIFARVGASDNIARGHSTFMVEMQETANILHTATSRSLVVLDEIGRGTATFDGLSIAWAVAEYLATNPKVRPEDAVRHALSRADRPGRRHAGRRQLPRRGARVEGRHHLPAQDRARADPTAATASRSRGSPGCPRAVIDRAREILPALERDELTRGGRPSVSGTPREPQRQLGLFQPPPPIDDELRAALGGARRRSHDADRGADAARGAEEGSRLSMTSAALRPARPRRPCLPLLAAVPRPVRWSAACIQRPVANPNVIVVGVTSGPNNLDPRIGHRRRVAEARSADLRQPDDARRAPAGRPEASPSGSRTRIRRPTSRLCGAACRFTTATS